MAAMKDHYIRALQYAESKSEFTLPELVESVGLTETQEHQLALQIHEKQIFQQNANSYINNYRKQRIELHLSVEDKFKLLNYVALEEARSSSRAATGFAISAILISIAASLISGYLSIKQLKSEILIPASFIQKIDDINKKQAEANGYLAQVNESPITRKLDEVSKNQAEANGHLSEINKLLTDNQKAQDHNEIRR